jgi:hypothetical protein
MEETPASYPPGPPTFDPPGTPPPSVPPAAVIPWEEPGRPWLSGAIETVKLLVASPRAAYERVPVRADVLRPVLFALLLGWIGLLFSAMWELTLGDMMRNMMPQGGQPSPPRLVYVIMMLFGPVIAAVGLLVSSALVHVGLMLVGGAKNGFVATLRAISYAQAANVAMVLPFCGSLVAWVGLVVLQVVGVSVLHRISFGKAVLGVLIPLVACCACVATLFAAFGAAILAGMGGLPGMNGTP